MSTNDIALLAAISKLPEQVVIEPCGSNDTNTAAPFGNDTVKVTAPTSATAAFWNAFAGE